VKYGEEVFPSPAGMSVPGREKLNYSPPGRVWLVTSRLGTRKWLTFFYSVPDIRVPAPVQNPMDIW
jgi:hypothetical protein